MCDVLVSTEILSYEHARLNEDHSVAVRDQAWPIDRTLVLALQAAANHMPHDELKRLVHVKAESDKVHQQFSSLHPAKREQASGLVGIHFGGMLSGNKLIDNEKRHVAIVSRWIENHTIIGGEMESSGLVYALSRGASVNGTSTHTPFVVIKAVCDWGLGKCGDLQPAAARHAVAFAHFALRAHYRFARPATPVFAHAHAR